MLLTFYIDNILIETFLPRNQSALTGALSFCRQDPIHIRDKGKATLASVVTPSLGFDKALGELLKKELIKQDGRVLSIHRVVQEAVNVSIAVNIRDIYALELGIRLIFYSITVQSGFKRVLIPRLVSFLSNSLNKKEMRRSTITGMFALITFITA